MSILRRALVLVAASLAMVALPALAQSSRTLEITGAVKSPRSWTAAELAAFDPAQIVTARQMRGREGQQVASTVRGVRVAALVEQAGPLGTGPHDWKTRVVIATATDGYRAVFSWPELIDTPVGDGALAVFERDGQPLDAREGAISLVSTADRRAGPRHVRNLVRLELRPLD